jgi:hypothetical protein
VILNLNNLSFLLVINLEQHDQFSLMAIKAYVDWLKSIFESGKNILLLIFYSILLFNYIHIIFFRRIRNEVKRRKIFTE